MPPVEAPITMMSLPTLIFDKGSSSFAADSRARQFMELDEPVAIPGRRAEYSLRWMQFVFVRGFRTQQIAHKIVPPTPHHVVTLRAVPMVLVRQ